MESLSSLKALREEQARLKAEYDKMEVRRFPMKNWIASFTSEKPELSCNA